MTSAYNIHAGGKETGPFMVNCIEQEVLQWTAVRPASPRMRRCLCKRRLYGKHYSSYCCPGPQIK